MDNAELTDMTEDAMYEAWRGEQREDCTYCFLHDYEEDSIIRCFACSRPIHHGCAVPDGHANLICGRCHG